MYVTEPAGTVPAKSFYLSQKNLARKRVAIGRQRPVAKVHQQKYTIGNHSACNSGIPNYDLSS